VQTGFSQVGDVFQSDAANAIAVFLGCNDDYSLVLCQSPDNTFFLDTPVGFIYLYRSLQTVTARPHHGSTEFMQPRPRRHVATQPEHVL
jgi:hypothetical protein